MPEKVYLPELRDQLREVAVATRAQRAHRPGRRPFAISGAVLAATAAAVIAFVIGAGSDPRAAATSVRSDGMLLNARFAVFEGASDANHAGDPFATTATPQLMAPLSGGARMKVIPDSVHRLALPGRSVWVAATERNVCISAASHLEPGATRVACARPTQILDDGLFVWGRPSHDDGQAEIAGLVPDGIQRVTFVLSDGSEVPATVSGNGVAAALAAPPTRVEFRGRDNVPHSAPL
jgi:hypothetical protein